MDWGMGDSGWFATGTGYRVRIVSVPGGWNAIVVFLPSEEQETLHGQSIEEAQAVAEGTLVARGLVQPKEV